MPEKRWFGIKDPEESIEAAIAFYIDEENEDELKIQMFSTIEEAIKQRDENFKGSHFVQNIFSLTYNEHQLCNSPGCRICKNIRRLKEMNK